MPIQATRDYYEVLGVPKDADAEAIKGAFRRLALRYHPDRSKEPGAEERFKELAEAYAVLSDPAKRADYDAGTLSGPRFAPEDLFDHLDLGGLFGEGHDFGTGVFSRLFGTGGPQSAARRGADLRIDLEIPLSAVATGSEEPIPQIRAETCPTCGGSGARPGTSPRSCSACGGTGRRRTTTRSGTVLLQHVATCEVCSGTGRLVDEPCPDCKGRGQRQVEEVLKVRIPAGIDDGVPLRVRGRGLASPTSGGAPGDLLVVVHSAPHPSLVRRGADLLHRAQVPVADAALGTRIEVPTLKDPVKVDVPPGTQPGAVLRVPGHGLPRWRASGRGDLYVTVSVVVPTKLSAEQRQLYEQLRQGPPAHRRRWRRHQPA